MAKKRSISGPLSKRMAAIDQKMRQKSQKNKKSSDEAAKTKRVCSILDCEAEAIRSLSPVKFESAMKLAGVKMKNKKSRRLFVCKAHYKALQKETKKEEKVVRPKFEKKTKSKAYNAKFMR